MKIIISILFFANALLGHLLFCQEIRLFEILEYGNQTEDISMISVSDVYQLSDHPDSSSIPDVTAMNSEQVNYFTLEGRYRSQLLQNTRISEKDSLFIYDYKHNELYTLSINQVKAVALLSPYVEHEQSEMTQEDFMIGFEINPSIFPDHLSHTYELLAYFGARNPFSKSKLQNIKWETIELTKFPLSMTEEKDETFNRVKAYKFETENMIYFLQDIHKYNYVWAKQLLVIDKFSNQKIYEKLFKTDEGMDFNSSESQYTGQLLKNKPEVIFGFRSHSFGCSNIHFLDSEMESISIHCDNRH